MQDGTTATQDPQTELNQEQGLQALEQELEKELSGDEGPQDPGDDTQLDDGGDGEDNETEQ